MDGDKLQKQAGEISALMAERLRVRGTSLDAQLRKAGRQLPKAVRRDGAYLAQAATLARNPKLARMVDETRADRAHERVVQYLLTVDPIDRLKGRVLGVLGAISTVVIVTFIAVVYVLVQRGYV